eukprot:TRINITY_DN12307_c0_g1_i1.p1 TRINITY_DN12307_c0_g1~~TRINITY_DN12307_c0_g1_i1.p1  ORF type:complete len:109 (-),score=0.09 TRINITY_DN12307_c0_g1_i1:13-339(-)
MLDFLLYPKVVRILQGIISRLLSNFSTLLFVSYPILFMPHLQENVYERVYLHFESSSIIDEIWAKFDNIKFGKALLTLPLTESRQVQITVTRLGKKFIRSRMLDNVLT